MHFVKKLQPIINEGFLNYVQVICLIPFVAVVVAVVVVVVAAVVVF